MLSLILPAYNEAQRLEHCVDEVKRVLDNKTDYEIIIAEDGSKDGTNKIAANLAKKHKNITHIHSDKKLGRGLALKGAFRTAKGDILAYIDVDLAVSAEYLPCLITYAKEYDVVTGSRYIKGADVKRPFLRKFFSQGYDFIIRILFGCKVYDFQCGFKAFSKRFVENVAIKIDEKTWAWDTVALVLASKKGYRIKDFPVKWCEQKGVRHSTNIKRMISDIKIHGGVITKLFFNKYIMQ